MKFTYKTEKHSGQEYRVVRMEGGELLEVYLQKGDTWQPVQPEDYPPSLAAETRVSLPESNGLMDRVEQAYYEGVKNMMETVGWQATLRAFGELWPDIDLAVTLPKWAE